MSAENCILGAIAGDIIGSPYEYNNVKSLDFELFTNETYFTDDSVLTVATMYALLHRTVYSKVYQHFVRIYPHRGYVGILESWINSDDLKVYNSWGNCSAMRVSPVGWYCDSIDDVLNEAKKSAKVTHNHTEDIKGAQAVAAAVFLARTGKTKDEIKEFIISRFDYDLCRKLDEIRPLYRFNESCQGTVPEAIIAFLESTDYENAVRLAVSIGGDSDTIAAITGGIAEAYYKEIPEDITDFVKVILGPDLMYEVIKPFSKKYRRFG
jgi:ADP-ribosylglycohydrolase